MLTGLVLLYLLRKVLVDLIVLILGFVGVIIGLGLVVGGLGMIFWGGRGRWGWG